MRDRTQPGATPAHNENRPRPCVKLPVSTLIAVLYVGAMFLSGCAVYRGKDFGHWAGRAENRRLTYIYNQKQTHIPTNGEFVMILPPLGNIPKESCRPFQACLQKEAQQNTPARVGMLSVDRHLEEYVHEKNLVPDPGQFDFQEVGRLGRLMGASHVVCVWVNRSQLATPQDMSLYFAVVESEAGRVVIEMNGDFDASEQEVVMALNDYLQGCRALEFDAAHLDFILKSPSEYQAFVAHECMQALTAGLWEQKPISPP